MRLLPALLPLPILAALMAPALAQDMSAEGTISMSGHGDVSGRPDMAFVDSGVTTQAETARDALNANTEAMNQLLEVLTEAGIERRDIQTANFSINPNYVYSSETDENGYSLPPIVDGYIVSNTVTIRVRELDTLGDVLDKAVTVGANTINGITFSVADPSELLDEARRVAFEDAQHKAELYAGIAGLELNEIVNITESLGYSSPQPYMARAMDTAQSAPVPIEAGELTFSIDVNVVWDLDQAE